VTDSRPTAIEPEAIAYARGLLKPPVEREQTWPALGAMALLALAALGLAFVMLLTPAPDVERAPIGDPVATQD
jgi:hypothetical protein